MTPEELRKHWQSKKPFVDALAEGKVVEQESYSSDEWYIPAEFPITPFMLNTFNTASSSHER